jgi:undecaprenyl-diphosphatase
MPHDPASFSRSRGGSAVFAVAAFAFLCVGLFLWLAGNVVGSTVPSGWDYGILSFARDLRISPLDGVMLFFTALGNWQSVTWGMICSVVFLGLMRQRRSIAALLISVVGGEIAVEIIKAVVRRPRPPVDFALVQAWGFSFPSGHGFIAFAFYGLLACFLFRSLKSEPMKILLLAGGAVLVAGIGISRVYLGVHWPSDVLASFVFGSAWLALFAAALEARPEQPRGSVPGRRRFLLLAAAMACSLIVCAFLTARAQKPPSPKPGTHVQRTGYAMPVTLVSMEYIRSRQVAKRVFMSFPPNMQFEGASGNSMTPRKLPEESNTSMHPKAVT